MVDITIENIVVSTQITGPVDLQKLSTILPGTKYNPDEVPALIFHIDAPKAVVMLFSDGHVMITGPRSTIDVETVIGLLSTKLTVAGDTVVSSPEVQSHHVVASVDLHKPLDLASLAGRLLNASYNPKDFPGIVYKLEHPNAVILLFHTGKVVCNVTSYDEVAAAIQTMTEKLSSLGIG
jgi:transcription initiation factor TFIID TATA-box-binding protein